MKYTFNELFGEHFEIDEKSEGSLPNRLIYTQGGIKIEAELDFKTLNPKDSAYRITSIRDIRGNYVDDPSDMSKNNPYRDADASELIEIASEPSHSRRTRNNNNSYRDSVNRRQMQIQEASLEGDLSLLPENERLIAEGELVIRRLIRGENE